MGQIYNQPQMASMVREDNIFTDYDEYLTIQKNGEYAVPLDGKEMVNIRVKTPSAEGTRITNQFVDEDGNLKLPDNWDNIDDIEGSLQKFEIRDYTQTADGTLVTISTLQACYVIEPQASLNSCFALRFHDSTSSAGSIRYFYEGHIVDGEPQYGITGVKYIYKTISPITINDIVEEDKYETDFLKFLEKDETYYYYALCRQYSGGPWTDEGTNSSFDYGGQYVSYKYLLNQAKQDSENTSFKGYTARIKVNSTSYSYPTILDETFCLFVYDYEEIDRVNLLAWTSLGYASNGAYPNDVGTAYYPIRQRRIEVGRLTQAPISNYYLLYDRLDISYIDTAASMYANCYNLIKLDVNWSDYHGEIRTTYLTSVSSAFANCWALSDLSPRTRDFSYLIRGTTTAVTSMFSNCYSLSGEIDATGWVIKTNLSMGSMFTGCYGLDTIKGMKTWTGTTTNVSSLFNNCYLLKEIDLSGMTLAPTTMASMCANNYSVRTIKFGTLDLSNCTTLASAFSACRSVTEIDFGTITPPTDKLTTIASIFAYTFSLREIDISGWNLSKASILGIFYYSGVQNIICNNVITSTLTQADTSSTLLFAYNPHIERLDSSWINMGVFSSTYAHLNGFRYLYNLKEWYPPLNIKKNMTISDNLSLSTNSLKRLINNLATVSSTTTLTLGANLKNKIVSDGYDVVAAATAKGWTIA